MGDIPSLLLQPVWDRPDSGIGFMTIASRRDTSMFNANKFKLGLFAPNCSNGLAMTTVPERWVASWTNNLALAEKAELAGLEFILPIARWHGYDGSEVTTQESTLETLTWATGLLASTKRISIFGTVHSPLINPVFAAKQVVTADLIGQGRFGLNVVSGWNKTEFKMFGVGLREHDERYAYTTEWLEIVKRIWAEKTAFDFNGRFFQLEGVVGHPKPYFGDRPLLMSAGSSPAGRAFAAQNADCLFMHLVDETTLADEIAAIRADARQTGRTDRIGVFSSGHVVCRPTQKEAEEYYEYYAVEKADQRSVETLMKTRAEGRSLSPGKAAQNRRLLASGIGTFAIVGSPDFVANKFHQLSNAGLDGMAFGLVNYLDELPLFAAEVLPRMERLGIRQAQTVSGASPAQRVSMVLQ
jgi:alkanesulfonate monooxygenase SsuD/methylene tetrahydromethanopterin reductase-like flavin-dependent oxidoreductase (luciferase family)